MTETEHDAVALTTVQRVLGPLLKPVYVIRFGFVRWGPDARRRWLLELRKACATTIDRIDDTLETM